MQIRDSLVPMGWIQLLPGFEKTPFIIVAGSHMMHLINLNNGYIEPFILVESTVAFGQQAFFFKRDKYVLSMHFTLHREIDLEHVRFNWIRMAFKPDFIEILEKFQRLPFSNPGQALQM